MAKLKFYNGNLCRPGRPRKRTKKAKAIQRSKTGQTESLNQKYRKICGFWTQQREINILPEESGHFTPHGKMTRPMMEGDFSGNLIPSNEEPIQEQVCSSNNFILPDVKKEVDENISYELPASCIVKQEPLDEDTETNASANISTKEELTDSTKSLNAAEFSGNWPIIVETFSAHSSNTDSEGDFGYATSLSRKELSGNDEKPDEWTFYGEFVASKLREIQDRHTQLQVQNRISNILIENEMKQLGKSITSVTNLHQNQSSPHVMPFSNIKQISSSSLNIPNTFTSFNERSTSPHCVTDKVFDLSQCSPTTRVVQVTSSDFTQSSSKSSFQQTYSKFQEEPFNLTAKSVNSKIRQSESRTRVIPFVSSTFNERFDNQPVMLTESSNCSLSSSAAYILPTMSASFSQTSDNPPVTSTQSSSFNRSSSNIYILPTTSDNFSQTYPNPPIASNCNRSSFNKYILPKKSISFSQTSANPPVTSISCSSCNQSISTPGILPTKSASFSQNSSNPPVISTPSSSCNNKRSSVKYLLSHMPPRSSQRSNPYTIPAAPVNLNQRSPVPYIFPSASSSFCPDTSLPYILPSASASANQNSAPYNFPNVSPNRNVNCYRPYILAPTLNPATAPVITMIAPDVSRLTYANNVNPSK